AVPVLIAGSFAVRALRRGARGLAPAGLLALLLASAFFVYLPVFQYARSHEREFGERMRTVSAVHASSMAELARILLVPSPEQRQAFDVLGKNARKHAAMFHLEGDWNGRHNLPGAPMLDPVTGFLFAAGL